MKAVFTLMYHRDRPTIIHNNVVEMPQKSANSSFKCLDCGLEWIENLHSPMIVSDEDARIISETQITIDCRTF